MGGVTQMSPEKRAAYGLPPLSEEEQKKFDDAQAAKTSIAQQEGRVVATTGPQGDPRYAIVNGMPDPNDPTKQVARDPVSRAEIDTSIAQGNVAGAGPTGAFGMATDPTAMTGASPDWHLYDDPTYAGNKASLAEALAARQGQPAKTMTFDNAAGGLMAQDRTRQLSLADALAERAAGRGPSVVQSQLQAATDQNLNSQLALAKSSTGNRSVAMKNAMMNSGTIGQQAANQSAQLKAQEQMDATGQLGGLLSGMQGQNLAQRGQDIGVGSQNFAGALEQQKQIDDMTRYYQSMGITLDQAKAQAMKEYSDAKMRGYFGTRSAQGAELAAKMQQDSQIAGGVASAVGALGSAAVTAASDRRVKKNVKDGSGDLADFLLKLKAHKYEYKDPKKPLRGDGEFYSPMAQELEKTRVGKTMVKDTPDGKVVDYGKGFGAMLAASAMLMERVKNLEGSRA